ncbi:MAG: hypothetical protein RL336_908 [Pseudomonadota bacterium]|jgi:hypothetical protein
MTEIAFTQVDYSKFRMANRRFAIGDVRAQGDATVIYDQRNMPVAMMKAASIDAQGRCHSPEYFIRAV